MLKNQLGQRCPILLFLLLGCWVFVGGEDRHDVHPYMDFTYPPPGHAFVQGEQIFCEISFYDLRELAGAAFDVQVWDATAHRTISSAQGAVGDNAQRNPDGSFSITMDLQALGQGSYALRCRFLLHGAIKTDIPSHPFRVQRPALSPPTGSMQTSFPQGTPGEPVREGGHTHMVVALVRMRNVARSARAFLKALAYFVHHTVVLDDASVDDTVRVVQEVAAQGMGINLLSKPPRREDEADKWGDMQRLLEEGRALGGTHFLVLHADEMLTTSLVMDTTWWDAMRALAVGESLSLVWVHFWKSMRYARADWMLKSQGPRSLRVVDVAFRDNGKCSYLSNRAADSGLSRHSHDSRKFDLSRIPYDLPGEQVLIVIGGISWSVFVLAPHTRARARALSLSLSLRTIQCLHAQTTHRSRFGRRCMACCTWAS